jgi:glycerophosphoryl diester phosphodiesterase
VALARRSLGPQLATAMGPRAVAALRAVALGRLPARFLPRDGTCLQVPRHAGPLTVVSPPVVETAHRHRLPVLVWTIDAEDEMDSLLDLGVDGIMTDDAPALRDVLVAREAWAR